MISCVNLWKRGQDLPRALRGSLWTFIGGLMGYLVFVALAGAGRPPSMGRIGARILSALGTAIPLGILSLRR